MGVKEETREMALEQPATQGWVPEVREIVWLPRKEGTLAKTVSTGEVRMVAPPYCRVLVRKGKGQRATLTFRIDQLRPLNPIKPKT